MSNNGRTFPFDLDESIGLFWICTTALRAYSAYNNYEVVAYIYTQIKNAPLLNKYLTSSKVLAGSVIPSEDTIPYAMMTGKVETIDKSLTSNDGQTKGVVRHVRRDLEYLFNILNLFKPSFSINIDSTVEAVPFRLRTNEESFKKMHIQPMGSIPILQSELTEVSKNYVNSVEESILNWIVEFFPGCSLLVREVLHEKMLPANIAVTVIGKALVNSEKKQILYFISKPDNDLSPYLITTMSPQDIVRKVQFNVTTRLLFSLYFGILTTGLTVVLSWDVYLKYKRQKRSGVFQSKFMNAYLFLCTFVFPTVVYKILL